MNEQNLIDGAHRSQSEVREIGRKGGIASGRARLAKRRGRELIQMMLALPVTDPRILDELTKMGICPKDMNNEVAMTARQIDKAIKKADTEAYNSVFKNAGYQDKEGININISDEKPPVIIFSNPEPATEE